MKKNYLFGAMALGLLFTGCSSDAILDNPGNVLEEDQNFYVNLRISGDIVGGSRSAQSDGTPTDGDFAAGSGTESTIDNAYFVFYDADGNVVGDVVNLEIANSAWQTETAAGAVEKYYKNVAKVSVMKGEKEPAQVICYLNPVSSGNLKVNLDEIQTLQLTNATKGSGASLRFPMSNSVFYPTTTATTPQIAVKLTKGVNVFDSEAAAEDARDNENNVNYNNYAEIYVERYATKLTFDPSAATQNDFVTAQRVWNNDGTEATTRKSISLHFTPQYWAVNAEAKETYVIKSFRKENLGSLAPDAYNYTYADLNSVINDGITGEGNAWVWNAPTYNRSYWGMSPAYFTNKYPEVSSDLDPQHSELQKYISYNELVDLGFAVSAESPVAATSYFKETTVGSPALASKNPAAAMPSVIYVGQYTVSVDGTAIAPENMPGFYTYLSGPVTGKENDQPYIYFRNTTNSLSSEVAGTTSMLKRFLIQCSILYKKVGNNYEVYELGNGNGLDYLADKLTVSQLSDAERKAYDGSSETELKLPHNARTLRFNAAPGTSDNIYIMTYEGYKQVVANDATITNAKTQMTVQQANIALAKNVGFAYSYINGHAYFNIPVRHLGWYRKGNLNNAENAVFNWNNVHVGDFGMVRNHAYTIEVGEINGLANGIGGDDVEIVPPAAESSYYVNYKVNVLKWAVVPAQQVDL